MSEAVGGKGPEIPRRCGRQRHRDNVPVEDPKEYYKRSITIPFLDHLLTQLHKQFSSDHQRVALGLSLVPSVMKDTPQWSEHVTELADIYKNDLPSPQNFNMELVCEMGQPQGRGAKQASRYCSLVWHQLLSVPYISGLKRLKRYLRSTMGQAQLNGLALMHFNHGMSIDYEAVLSIFARKHPRRMTMLDVLDSDTSWFFFTFQLILSIIVSSVIHVHAWSLHQ